MFVRIKVKGRIKLEDIHEVSNKVIEYLERYSINKTRDITFYFTILDPETKKKTTIINPEIDQELDGWLFKDPNKKIVKKKPNVIKVDFSSED